MPRFAELLIGHMSRNKLVFMGGSLFMVLLLAYGFGGETTDPLDPERYEVEGVSPTEDAGILGGLATQSIEVEQLRSQVRSMTQTLERLERQVSVPRNESAVTRELREQMRRLQAHIAQSQARAREPVSAPAPEPHDPGIVLRTIRRGRPEVKTRPIIQPGIDVLDGPQRVSRKTGPVPYLPPQSYAYGHVIDGYTGLAIETGFPLTIAIDQPFLTANHHTVPVTGCRLGARATTEELTARSRASLTNITCVDEDGQTLERPIKGYVTAADNIHGQFAEVFWHERDMVKAFGKASIPVALVSLFRETRQVVEQTSVFGVTTATGNTVAQQVAGRMANIYLDKAEKLASPVVWVPPNAPVYIYITQGAELDSFVKADSAPLYQPTATRLAQ